LSIIVIKTSEHVLPESLWYQALLDIVGNLQLNPAIPNKGKTFVVGLPQVRLQSSSCRTGSVACGRAVGAASSSI